MKPLLFALVITFAHAKEINKELLEELLEKALEEQVNGYLGKRDCDVNKYNNNMGVRKSQSKLLSRLRRMVLSQHEGNRQFTTDKLKVYIGDHNVAVDTESSQVVMKPAKIITHPQYNPAGDNKNDIALVKLPEAVSLNEYVRLICFPKNPLPAGSNCVALMKLEVSHC